MPQGAVPPPREQDIVTGPGKRLLFFLPPLAAFRPQGQDLLSGLAITGLLLPQALAYSSIGDMPAQAGIIALLAGLFCYGILGGSRFALVSPTSSSAVVLAAATASLAGNSPSGRLVVAGALVLAISLVFVLSAIIRIGNITDFIDRPVLRGFTFGLCIFIVIKQMDTVLGVQSTSQSLIYFIVDIVSQAAQWHLPSILLSAASLACLLILGRLKRLPSSTLVIILGVLASYFLDLSSYGVPLVGQISMTSAVPTIPVLGWKEWADILKLAVGITFILYAESYGAIGSFAMKHGDTLSPNRDLFALGVCNFLSGLFQGMPVGAGYSATAANETYGAQTRMSGIISLLITVVILLTALPFIAWIPRPVLASIVIYIMLSTLRLSFFRRYLLWRNDRLIFMRYTVWRNDRLISTISVLAVLFIGVLQGLLVAVGISIIMMLRQIANASITELGRLGNSHDFVSLSLFQNANAVEGLLILRPDQALFFANADRILLLVRRAADFTMAHTHTVILSLELSNGLDTTSVEALRGFFLHLRQSGKRLILARLKDPVHDVLQLALGSDFPEVLLSRLSVSHAVRTATEPTEA